MLVTDGGTGRALSTLGTVRALAAAGYRPAVSTSGGVSLAAASRFCARAIEVPPVTDEGYAPAIQAELATWPYLTVLPTSDAALLELGAPVDHLVDKEMLAGRARAAGLVVPPTETFSSLAELVAAAPRLDYPVVVKPTVSRSPARRVESAAELARSLPEAGSIIVQPYLTDPLWAVAGVVFGGKLVAAAHQRYLRIWPPDCGGACAAVTAEPDLEREAGVLRLLTGYEGIFMAQFAGPHLVDLNPRAYGSLPLAVAAGANLAGIWCDLLAGEQRCIVRARPGVFYRWLEGDLRHLAAAVRAGTMRPTSALRALRPRPGAAHGPESLSDPAPMLARLRYAAARLRERSEAGSSPTVP
ncbi:MAG: hypothetical protein ACRDJG_04270 [Actinomycetota bacterium]